MLIRDNGLEKPVGALLEILDTLMYPSLDLINLSSNGADYSIIMSCCTLWKLKCGILFAPIAQLVERLICNQNVLGSNPSWSFRYIIVSTKKQDSH